MYVKVRVKGIEFIRDELKNVIALAKELEKRVDNINTYCTSVGIEIAEYKDKAISPKPLEEAIYNASQNAPSCKLYEQVDIR